MYDPLKVKYYNQWTSVVFCCLSFLVIVETMSCLMQVCICFVNTIIYWENEKWDGKKKACFITIFSLVVAEINEV